MDRGEEAGPLLHEGRALLIFCRFQGDDGTPRYGTVESHKVQEISPNPFAEFEAVGEEIPSPEIRLLPPVQPSKIICVGINYREHAKEMGKEVPKDPLIFLKPPSAVIGPDDSILYPRASRQVDYEAELAVVIKKKAKNVEVEKAQEYILGYTCFNDVTARDLQRKDSQWSRAKGFDTFASLGPWVVTDLDISDLSIESYLNGEIKQKARTGDMIFKAPFLLSYISGIMTLEPGDVIATGTPHGIGPMKQGDEIVVSIEGIGMLKNTISTE